MSIKQKIKQLAIMREMLADMRQEREEAKAKYSETSEFMQQLDADISLAMVTIRGCERIIKESR
jgi:hypothetical protein